VTANDNDMNRIWIEAERGVHLYLDPAKDGEERMTLGRVSPILSGYEAVVPTLNRPAKAFPDLASAKSWVRRMNRPWLLRMF